MHIPSDLTDAHRAAALLVEWDVMMAEVDEFVAMDRKRRQGAFDVLVEFQDVTLKGD